jgi:hypothetical protein
MRTKAEIYARIKQHVDNLHLWEIGYLDPTEPDPIERACVMRELKAAIAELEWMLERD